MPDLLDIPRRDCDTRKSYPALCDYCQMGAGRSLRKLLDEYRHQSDPVAPPTRRVKTLKRWSTEHDWQERAAAYDRRVAEYKREQAKKTLREGLALDHHRVDELKSIFGRLKGELEEKQALWLDDKKQLGKGDEMQIVDIVRYNSRLIDDLRGLLDDLAQETGGRVKRQEVSGPDGGPVRHALSWYDPDASEEES